ERDLASESTSQTDGGAVDAGAATDAPSANGADPAADDAADADDAMQELIAAGESPECPDCGGMARGAVSAMRD
ncbi:MAG: hypothetical protein R6U98_31770, partial [Pirellulaceae bacterium]